MCKTVSSGSGNDKWYFTFNKNVSVVGFSFSRRVCSDFLRGNLCRRPDKLHDPRQRSSHSTLSNRKADHRFGDQPALFALFTSYPLKRHRRIQIPDHLKNVPESPAPHGYGVLSHNTPEEKTQDHHTLLYSCPVYAQ